jgi:hypothetical protein
MNDGNRRPPQDPKPRRESFASDDAFGEAYGHWMSRQPKTAPAPVKLDAPVPAAKRAPVSHPAPVSLATSPASPRISARTEIERDTWNQHTKARFMKAKTSAPVDPKK